MTKKASITPTVKKEDAEVVTTITFQITTNPANSSTSTLATTIITMKPRFFNSKIKTVLIHLAYSKMH